MLKKSYQQWKRILDVMLSAAGLIVLFPLFLILVLAIKADSPGPVLFRQKRIGIHKKYFYILKFRTMRIDTPKDTPTHLLENPEQYITKTGRFLRKTSLDELPQIFNILKGDMSIIGPRPALWNQYDLIAERDKYGANDILPGLTGWAQINGRDELEIPLKARMDGEYVQRMSFWFDVRCFFETIFSVLRSDGVMEGGTGKKPEQEFDTDNMDTGILISVITPAYNSAKYLPKTIESVRNQTYPNWELLIIDDCSADNTAEIVQRYAERDERIRLLKQNYNLGAAAARNAGLDAARGKYIAFLDSDDFWDKNKLLKQLSFMEKNGYVLTYTNYQKFNSDTGRRGKVMKAPPKMKAKDIYSNTAIGCLTVMVNRDMAGDFHMPILDHTEDNITWQKILQKENAAYGIDEILAYYREGNEASLTQNKKHSAKLQWKTYRKYYGFSIIKSSFYFARYALNAVKRHL